ncbi:MAG: hypothetical protein AABY22_04390 [Nanoarchaeota archaeon]
MTKPTNRILQQSATYVMLSSGFDIRPLPDVSNTVTAILRDLFALYKIEKHVSQPLKWNSLFGSHYKIVYNDDLSIEAAATYNFLDETTNLALKFGRWGVFKDLVLSIEQLDTMGEDEFNKKVEEDLHDIFIDLFPKMDGIK